MRIFAFSTILLLAGAASLWADTLFLKNGAPIVGIAQELHGRIRLETDFGAMEVPSARVRELRFGPCALQEYRARAAALPGGDAAAHFALGEWALAQDLPQSATAEFRQVVAVEPDHAAARRRLGHEKYGGAWMTHAEAMHRRGFVAAADGSWVTPEELARRTAAERERLAREEARRAEQQERERQEQLARQAYWNELRISALESEVSILQSENDRLRSACKRPCRHDRNRP